MTSSCRRQLECAALCTPFPLSKRRQYAKNQTKCPVLLSCMIKCQHFESNFIDIKKWLHYRITLSYDRITFVIKPSFVHLDRLVVWRWRNTKHNFRQPCRSGTRRRKSLFSIPTKARQANRCTTDPTSHQTSSSPNEPPCPHHRLPRLATLHLQFILQVKTSFTGEQVQSMS